MPAQRVGGEVELDRCRECGGVWFDAGELADATSKTVNRSAGASTRSCPACGAKMQLGRLTGGPPVDHCPSCRGTFVTESALETVAVKRTARALAPEGTGFVCDECGARKPFAEGRATTLGLKCSDCWGDDELVPKKKEQERSAFARFLAWLGGEPDAP
jgi:Zn-finger nucleic acid-binding protein